MDRCEQCGIDVVKGTGVDHELNATEVIVFCSMDHFKAFIDKHLGEQSDNKNAYGASIKKLSSYVTHYDDKAKEENECL